MSSRDFRGVSGALRGSPKGFKYIARRLGGASGAFQADSKGSQGVSEGRVPGPSGQVRDAPEGPGGFSGIAGSFKGF